MTNISRTGAVVARSALLDVKVDQVIPAPVAAPRSWLELSPDHAARAAAGIHTPLTIVLDGPELGRIYGDVAPKNQCILDGRPGCWTAPNESTDDLSRSMNGHYETAEGDDLIVGVIPMDCNHAPDGTTEDAIDFMAHTGVQLAIVRYVHTPTTIAAVGVVSPGLTYGQAVRARAAAQSGDWRALLREIKFDDGRPPEFRFTGSVTVNVGGLPLAVRMTASASPYGPAIVIPQETTMNTPTNTRTAGQTWRLEPIPPIDHNDQVTFGGGSRVGRVTGLTLDTAGNVLVTVAEVFANNEMLTEEADGFEAIVVPIQDVTSTGLRYDIEGWDDSGSHSDVVVAAAHACSCNDKVTAATDLGAAPANVTVADPTNDILLERLDTAEKTIAALNERLDTIESAAAMSHEAAQVAASLGLTK